MTAWMGSVLLLILMVHVITDQYNKLNPLVVTKTVTHEVQVYKTVYVPSQSDNFITSNIKQVLSKCNTGHGELWDLKYAAESNCGKNMWQKSNRGNKLSKKGFAGHFQMGWKAMKQIKCITKKCLRDRFKFEPAIKQAKLLHKDAIRQVKSFGCKSEHPVYIQYLYHQQGPFGICSIIKGKLTKTIRKNMINNSTLTKKSTKRMSDKTMSKLFLLEWKLKISNGGLKL